MTETEFIFSIIVMITMIILVGRYALLEGQRIEQYKKFKRNMDNYDKKKHNDIR